MINKQNNRQMNETMTREEWVAKETGDDLAFLRDYISAQNASSGSKYDANSNVTSKNISTLMGELPKRKFININRKMLTDRIEKMYGKETADEYLRLLNGHFIYKNDETSIANYCASITMYPWLLNGTTGLGGIATAPTNLKSFCGGFVNMVFIVSSMLSGACATPEFLMYMNYFIEGEYGDDWTEHLDDVVDLSKKRRTLRKVITDSFEQIVYSLNQPTGARNFQAVFWNISYYDKYYFDSIFGNFIFPDGKKPTWDNVSVLQKMFMKWFNQERTKAVLTFPVETMAMLTNGERPKDEEWFDFTAEMYAEGHSFFTYLSDSADSLSSCCFSADTNVLWKSSTTGVRLTTFKELYQIKTHDRKDFRMFHNGRWVDGRVIKLPSRKMYKVTTSNKKKFILTDNHINVTYDGEKPTSALTTNDYLMFNTSRLCSDVEADEHLTYAQGFVIGSFLGDGSFGKKRHLNGICDTTFSLRDLTLDLLPKYLKEALTSLSGDEYAYRYEENSNHLSLRVRSSKLVQFIQRWIDCEEGCSTDTNRLNLDCLLQSVEFRKGILDGWYKANGGISNRCYTTSDELLDDMEALITSLGYYSIIDSSYNFADNFTLHCVRWYSESDRSRMQNVEKNIFKQKNNSVYFKIMSIEEVEYDEPYVYCFESKNADEPYFTLPCGLITHNCRLRNEITDNTFSYTLGAGGVSTGSKSVLTINVNRVIRYGDTKTFDGWYKYLRHVVDLCHKVQCAYDENLRELLKGGLLPLFSCGYINIDRQYLTIGINGLVESAEWKGLPISDNGWYQEHVESILGIVQEYNKQYSKDGRMFNCEMIPAENVGVKFAKWDKEDGWFDGRRICYNSYFYKVEDGSLNILDKIHLHGKGFIEHLTGGSALHLNLEEHLSKAQYKTLLASASKCGCNYLTFNIPNTVCNECGHIDKRYVHKCPNCGSENVDFLTRIIGYIRRISNFSKERQAEAEKRHYHNKKYDEEWLNK